MWRRIDMRVTLRRRRRGAEREAVWDAGIAIPGDPARGFEFLQPAVHAAFCGASSVGEFIKVRCAIVPAEDIQHAPESTRLGADVGIEHQRLGERCEEHVNLNALFARMRCGHRRPFSR